MAVLPEYDFRVGWDAKATGAFTFGESTLGGGDGLGSQLFTDFSGVHDDITEFVRGFRVNRGRDDRLAGTPMGECTLRLVDLDGRFNPRNESSPLSGQLLPMRPLRVRATHSGVTYGVFRGFIRTIEHDPVEKVTTIQAGDLFLWLSRVFPTIASTETTTGGAIGLLLDAVGFTEVALRSVDVSAGDPVTFSADGSSSALALIEELLLVERGLFFADGDGVATYLTRYDLQGNTTSVATISAPLTAVPSVEVERIRNRASVSVEGGPVQVASDPDSAATYGWSDVQPITSVYLVDDAQAASLASYLVTLYRDATGNVRSLRLVNGDNFSTTQMLARRLQDRVTVLDPVVGSTDHVIEGVALELDGVELFWEATLSERGAPGTEFFIFGSGTLGGGDVLGY